MRNLIFESAQNSRVQRFSNVQKIETTFFLKPFNNEHCTHPRQIRYKIIYCINFALSKLCNLFLKLRWKKTKDMILCLHVNYIVFCMKGSFTVTLSPNSNFVVDHNVSSMYCWSSSGKYVNLQVIRSIHKCYIFKTDRRAKSHDFVVSLTISRPISCSHMLATNLSRFLAKSNSKNILELQSWFSR